MHVYTLFLQMLTFQELGLGKTSQVSLTPSSTAPCSCSYLRGFVSLGHPGRGACVSMCVYAQEESERMGEEDTMQLPSPQLSIIFQSAKTDPD